MKKFFLSFCLSLVLALSLSVSAYADGYPIWDNWTPGQAGYIIGQALHGTGNRIYNVNCNASSYTYSVTVSYDSLSDICATANGVGVTCSVYYNSHAEVYVIAVSDRTTLGLTGTYGVIGNPDGYIYTAEKDDGSSAETVNSISDTLMYMRLHVTNIMNRCNDFYTQLEYICDRFDSIGTTLNTGFSKIDQTNSLLNQMIRQLDHIDDSLYDESFPLISKLDEIKTAIENITISADGLTVSAYDDSTLLSYLTSGLTYWENIDMGIQSLNTALYSGADSMLSKRLLSISNDVTQIRSAIGVGVQGRSVINLLSSVSSYVSNIDTRIANLAVAPYDDTNMIAAVNSVETALSNLSLNVGDVTVAPTDLTPVITSIDAVGVNIEDLNANFNTSLGSLVDKLDVIVDKSSESVENLTVEISVDNEAHNVFYVTDEDGNEESLVDFSGDVLKAGGKLLNFLFKVCFDGAIDNLDGSIDDMDSFYFDGAELGGSLWE